ncbi:Pmp3 family protein [Acinetobacter junii]|uniref:Pmp3 family protein n=1 Tax=Acinetobacter junii TaxID=40215 RepID=UPI00102EBF72|nr:Pmp3 family protein [Acinetobacter junii]RZG70495.1 Pmp3 family protein [Acinetobacter junii]
MPNKCISCNNCGHIGWSKNRGNFLITIVLVIFFFVPAVIYEIWRRSGLGICSNCGSNLVVPSNQCNLKDRQFQLDISGILLIVGGLIGSLFLILYLLGLGAEFYRNTFKPSQEKLYERCYADGLKHYQTINQYPMLADGKTLTMDKIQLDCKDNTTGKYVAK